MPFECPRCVIDTNVLSDFFECGCLHLIWRIFPGGVWIDPYVCEELKAKYDLDVQQELGRLNLQYFFTNDYDAEHFAEMGEIKARKAALKTADIACIMNAKIHGATCLSADMAVYKTCADRGVKVARHGGILLEAVRRQMLTNDEARGYFEFFIERGLMMKPSIRDEIIAKLS